MQPAPAYLLDQALLDSIRLTRSGWDPCRMRSHEQKFKPRHYALFNDGPSAALFALFAERDLRGMLYMAAEFETHRRQKLVAESVLLARTKPCE